MRTILSKRTQIAWLHNYGVMKRDINKPLPVAGRVGADFLRVLSVNSARLDLYYLTRRLSAIVRL